MLATELLRVRAGLRVTLRTDEVLQPPWTEPAEPGPIAENSFYPVR